jgi:DNA-binding NarL/FixJ family response regulator
MRALAEAALAGAAEKCPPREGSPIPRPWLESIRSKALIYAKKLSVAAEQYRTVRNSQVLTALSFREMEVLKGLSQGLTREEIAGDINFSVSTVKNVIAGLYAKLGAHNRADAIRIAGSTGLIRRPQV